MAVIDFEDILIRKATRVDGTVIMVFLYENKIYKLNTKEIYFLDNVEKQIKAMIELEKYFAKEVSEVSCVCDEQETQDERI